MITLEAKTGTTELVRLELPATYRYLSVLGACIRELLTRTLVDCDRRTIIIHQVELAVHEVCVNIVSHAYHEVADRTIRLTFQIYSDDRKLEIELQDSGQNFDYKAVPLPDLENGQEHGYGLFIVQSLMDEVIYEPRLCGNYWRLVKFF